MTLSLAEKKNELDRQLSTDGVLLFPDQRLAVFFSPKAAASSVLNWYLELSDTASLARDARTKFGAGKYELMMARQRSARYQQALNDLKLDILHDQKRWSTVKIVRNPFDRAVSAFLMVMYLRNHTLSFRDFLSLPTSFFTRFGDGHCRQQYSDLERLGILKLTEVLKIEDGLDAIFSSMEKRFGLPSRAENSKTHANKSKYLSSDDIESPVADLPISSEDLRAGRSVPPRHEFLDEKTCLQILDHYQEDFAAYGYETNLTSSGEIVPPVSPTVNAEQFLLDELTGGLSQQIRELESGKRIAFWGAGSQFWEIFFSGILDDKSVVAVVDSSAGNRATWSPLLHYNFDVPIVSPDELKAFDFDNVVITISAGIDAVEAQLLQLGIGAEKIISTKTVPEVHPINMG